MQTLTKVILIIVFILYYLPITTLAQAPDTFWTKTFNFGDNEIATSIHNKD